MRCPLSGYCGTWCYRQKRPIVTRNEIIETIYDFLDGTSNDAWAWSDFLDTQFSDKKIEDVRLEIIQISQSYPATQDGWWCSAEGLEALKVIVKRLESQDW